jgi:hypothetical protein
MQENIDFDVMPRSMVSDRIFTRLVLLTPEIAEKWLEHNVCNRNLMQATVEHYTRLMKTGQWTANGEPMQFNSDGVLMNGQHRCEACVKSGVSIPISVTWGVAPEARNSIDRGRPKSLGDLLNYAGHKWGMLLASVASEIWASQTRPRYRPGSKGGKTFKITGDEVEELLARDPKIEESIRVVGVVRRHPQVRIAPTTVACCWYWFQKKDPQAATKFFEDLATGDNLPGTDPVKALRETLLKENSPFRRTMDRVLQFALTIKAWNMRRAGRYTRVLVWKDSVEDFPKVM